MAEQKSSNQGFTDECTSRREGKAEPHEGMVLFWKVAAEVPVRYLSWKYSSLRNLGSQRQPYVPVQKTRGRKKCSYNTWLWKSAGILFTKEMQEPDRETQADKILFTTTYPGLPGRKVEQTRAVWELTRTCDSVKKAEGRPTRFPVQSPSATLQMPQSISTQI